MGSEEQSEAELGQGAQQAVQAGRRASCLPYDIAGEEPLASELRAMEDWKENHNKEYNKEKNWQKEGFKRFILICNFLFSLLRAAGYTLENLGDWQLIKMLIYCSKGKATQPSNQKKILIKF